MATRGQKVHRERQTTSSKKPNHPNNEGMAETGINEGSDEESASNTLKRGSRPTSAGRNTKRNLRMQTKQLISKDWMQGPQARR